MSSPGQPDCAGVIGCADDRGSEARRWVAKDFLKIERVKSLSSSGDGVAWKIARIEEAGQWKFADGADQLNTSVATAAISALTALALADVAPDVKSETLDKPRTFVAETFDNLVYTIKVAKKPDTDNYYLWFTVNGTPPRERTA